MSLPRPGCRSSSAFVSRNPVISVAYTRPRAYICMPGVRVTGRARSAVWPEWQSTLFLSRHISYVRGTRERRRGWRRGRGGGKAASHLRDSITRVCTLRRSSPPTSSPIRIRRSRRIAFRAAKRKLKRAAGGGCGAASVCSSLRSLSPVRIADCRAV